MPLSNAVRLAHALCQAVADEVGIRVLFIKGPIATQQGLRDRSRVSGDVDVLCRPEDHDALVGALCRRGWRQRPTSTAAREFVTHSSTLLHPDWPCDIDVHVRFPGFFADPGDVFETLWCDRELHSIAEVEVSSPSRLAQWLILLLHGLRSPELARNATEVDTARISFRDELSGDERADLLSLVDDTGAVEVTADFFRSLGVPRQRRATPTAEFALWQLQAGPSRTESWMLLLTQARGWKRLHVLVRALIPKRAELVADHPDANEGTRQLLRAYLRRLRRAATLAPRAAMNVLRAYRDVHASGPAAALRITPLQHTPSAAPAASGSVTVDVSLPGDAGPATQAPVAPIEREHPRARWAADRSAPSTEDGQAESPDAVFVLPLTPGGSQVPLALRDTAADLWSIVEEVGLDVDAVTEVAEQWWGIPFATLRADVSDFVGSLVAASTTPLNGAQPRL